MFCECNDMADSGCNVCLGACIIFMRQSEKGSIAPSAVSVLSQNRGMFMVKGMTDYFGC